jgi:hypothetical protein
MRVARAPARRLTTRAVKVFEDDIVANARRLAAEIGPAAAPEFWRIDNANARAMREGNL